MKLNSGTIMILGALVVDLNKRVLLLALRHLHCHTAGI